MNILPYVGIPYVIGGESFEGADCYGIAKLFCRNELKIHLPNYIYTETNNEKTAEASILLAKNGIGEKWHKVDVPKLGTIVTFRIMGHEVHCGVMIDNERFLHSLKGRHSCIEDLSHVNWSHRLTGAYEWNKN